MRWETAAEDLDQLLVARPRRAVFPGDKQQAAERGGIEHLTVETARGVDQGFVGSECSVWNAISPYRGEAFLRGAGEGPECGYPRLLVRSDTQTSLETVEQDLAAQMERVSGVAARSRSNSTRRRFLTSPPSARSWKAQQSASSSHRMSGDL